MIKPAVVPAKAAHNNPKKAYAGTIAIFNPAKIAVLTFTATFIPLNIAFIHPKVI